MLYILEFCLLKNLLSKQFISGNVMCIFTQSEIIILVVLLYLTYLFQIDLSVKFSSIYSLYFSCNYLYFESNINLMFYI